MAVAGRVAAVEVTRAVAVTIAAQLRRKLGRPFPFSCRLFSFFSFNTD
jgi:hypothetical protein